MKTIHWLLCVLAGLPAIVNAQSRIVTPFTPREVDSLGRKVYVDPQPQASRRSVSVGYGFMSATTSDNVNSIDKIAYVHLQQGYRLHPHVNGSTGTISVSFGYEATPWLEFNLPMAYAKNWGSCDPVTIKNNAGVPVGRMDLSSTDNWFIILPNARINWLRNGWLSLYSRAGAGVSFVTRSFESKVHSSDPDVEMLYGASSSSTAGAAAFAWQLSPVGVEVGTERVGFFAEGGYGFMGIINVGLKFKVGKRLPSGAMSNSKSQRWFEEYMRM